MSDQADQIDPETAALEAELAKELKVQEQLIASNKKKDVEFAAIRERAVRTQADSEREEEHITNNLFRKLDALKKEKHDMVHRLKKEESFRDDILNQIAQVRKQKVDIENKLEHEQEAVMHDLQRQLLSISEEKRGLEIELHNERTEFLLNLQQRLQTANSQQQQQQQQQQQSPPESLQQLLATPTKSASQQPGPASAQQQQQQQQRQSTPSQRQRRNSSAGGHRSHGHQRTASQSSASSVSSRSPSVENLPKSETLVLSLEDEVTQLLELHEAKRLHLDEMQATHDGLCTKLRSLQTQNQLELFRAAKLKEDLEKAQNDLSLAKTRETKMRAVSPFHMSTSSSEDIVPEAMMPSPNITSAGAHQSTSPPTLVGNEDVRTRTRRVLSTASTSSRDPSVASSKH